MSERLLFLFKQDEPTPSALARFAARITFLEQQLNAAEEELAAADEHHCAAFDLGVQGLWDALEALERQVVWRAWERGDLDFRVPEPPSST